MVVSALRDIYVMFALMNANRFADPPIQLNIYETDTVRNPEHLKCKVSILVPTSRYYLVV